MEIKTCEEYVVNHLMEVEDELSDTKEELATIYKERNDYEFRLAELIRRLKKSSKICNYTSDSYFIKLPSPTSSPYEEDDAYAYFKNLLKLTEPDKETYHD